VSRVLDREGLRSIIAGVSGLRDGAVFWANDPNPTVGDMDRAQVTLELFSMGALGVDEHRRYFNPPDQPPNSYETIEIGNRELVVTIRVETFDGGVEAAEILDAIRTGIRAEAVTAQLDAIALALEWAEKSTRVRNVIDNRVVSTAVADFRFGGVARQVSQVLTETQGGFIESIDVDNQVPGTLTP
jgi:hypothetical protein